MSDLVYSLFTFKRGRERQREEGDMLTGQYQRSLDSKSRVTLPAILRKQFGELVQLIPRKDSLYGYTP